MVLVPLPIFSIARCSRRTCFLSWIRPPSPSTQSSTLRWYLCFVWSSIMKFLLPIICSISKTVITASAVTLPAWGAQCKKTPCIWLLNYPQQARSRSMIVTVSNSGLFQSFHPCIAVDNISWNHIHTYMYVVPISDISCHTMAIHASTLLEQCPSEYDKDNRSSGG